MYAYLHSFIKLCVVERTRNSRVLLQRAIPVDGELMPRLGHQVVDDGTVMINSIGKRSLRPVLHVPYKKTPGKI